MRGDWEPGFSDRCTSVATVFPRAPFLLPSVADKATATLSYNFLSRPSFRSARSAGVIAGYAEMESSLHILVVDDDREIRSLLERHLIGQGGGVSIPGDGHTMDECLVISQIDLAVLDVALPDSSGGICTARSATRYPSPAHRAQEGRGRCRRLSREPLSRNQLLDITHRRDTGPFDRAVNVLISRVRRKLGDSCDETMLKTQRNGDYQLAVHAMHAPY